ncbi:glycosyltransferase family 2 protein [Candidatus Venteria ishoeyi]|uniref:N-glycosyltransferase n=1 Tax=Candidatus Venteria ishoeyi TaxID=1899563 RepID=A0A1H6F963_9GAMM|nr:glycosyltransferase [Candidatus Venteria ishoeyi]SEH05525.1 N-glycosyltransferase [Candidatus Venteria ishoeyi]
MNISLLIGLKNNLDYNIHFYNTTRELYPNVELCFVSYGSEDGTHEWLDSLNDENIKYFYSDEQKTFSDTFNKAAELATKDYVAYLHNDIVLAPNFLENIGKHVGENNIVAYTTIEPPIFAGHERPGKIIHDLGDSLETFSKEGLYKFVEEKQKQYQDKTESGITFFMCMPRKQLLDIGGLDNLYNPMFCEDDDLIYRWELLGMNCITSLDAICYHFVSKTSRFSEEYQNLTQQIEIKSNKNYIRKWGTRSKTSKYDIGFRVQHTNSNILELLEPWCSTILIDDEMGFITSHYLDKEQPNTIINLKDKIKTTPYDSLDNEIVVDINVASFHQEDFAILQQLPEIIQDSGEIGNFQLGNLNITIKEMNEYQTTLIKL